jgi:hypothetical protein
MKAFYRTAVALFLSLVVFFLTIGPAAAASAPEAIEIRGPVYDDQNIDDIIDTYGDGTTLTVDATQFAAFYYNIDEKVTIESLTVK